MKSEFISRVQADNFVVVTMSKKDDIITALKRLLSKEGDKKNNVLGRLAGSRWFFHLVRPGFHMYARGSFSVCMLMKAVEVGYGRLQQERTGNVEQADRGNS